MIVAGIDPGSRFAGVCILELDGSKMRLLSLETMRLHGVSKIDRLLDLSMRLGSMLHHAKPLRVAVEAGAVHRFAKAALVVGEARGIALAAAAQVTRSVYEVQVQSARKAIGVAAFAQRRDHGKLATRQRVAMILNLKHAPTEDEADAAALAIWAAGRA